jgi:hypothetical protein
MQTASLQAKSPAAHCQDPCNLIAALQNVDLATCRLIAARQLSSAEELQFVSLAATFPVNSRLAAQVQTFQPCCKYEQHTVLSLIFLLKDTFAKAAVYVILCV